MHCHLMAKGNRRASVGAVLIVLLLWGATSLFQIRKVPAVGTTFSRSLPLVGSGDQPHYFAMLHSFLDHRTVNNTLAYQEAYEQGKNTLGQSFRGAPIDHHTLRQLPKGAVLGVRLTRPSGPWEIPIHPIALPLGLSVLLYPLKSSPHFLEHVAVGFAAIPALLAVVLVMETLYRLGLPSRTTAVSAILLGATTPLWHYSAGLWPDAYLAAAVFAFFFLLVMVDRPFLAGLALGAGFLVKWPAIVICMPALLLLAYRRRWTALAALAGGLLPALAFQGAYNWWAMGDPFSFTIAGVSNKAGNLGKQFIALLFSPTHGLVVFAPVLVFALPGAIRLLRSRRWEGGHLAGIAIAYMGYFATLSGSADFCSYGPREMLPLIPLLILAVAVWLSFPPAPSGHPLPGKPSPEAGVGSGTGWRRVSRAGRWAALFAFGGCALIGLATNATAAFARLACYDKSPIAGAREVLHSEPLAIGSQGNKVVFSAASDKFGHQWGALRSDPEASQGVAWVGTAEDQGRGALLFGPYVRLAPGDYRATFFVKYQPPAGGTATLDVFCLRREQQGPAGSGVLASRALKEPGAGYHSYALRFSLPEGLGGAPLETRVVSNTPGIAVDRVELERLR